MSGPEPVKEGNVTMLAQLKPVAVAPQDPMTIEDQLGCIITSAREVAVVAEELLREIVAQDASATVDSADSQERGIPHAITVAPRLLAATQQQLTSLLAMLKTV